MRFSNPEKLARKRSTLFFLFIISITLVPVGNAAPTPAPASPHENAPMHWSGDKTVWDRKKNRVELFGHAAVHQPGESLTGDYITLDLDSRVLKAKGNCIYIASGAIMYGEEMEFNLDTRTGSIVAGRVANEQFSLRGERINKLGATRYQTHWGEYTTCHDCPHTWSLLARDVDMEVEGYAFMEGVSTKIDGGPLFWSPYLIIPLKTKRQTGLLFPSFSFTELGFRFIEPFFWAINDWSDMTFGLGHYGGQGSRFTWETRYQLTKQSGATINYYFLQDQAFQKAENENFGRSVSKNRWAVRGTQRQVLPWGFDQKIKFVEVGDNYYPLENPADQTGASEGFIGSHFILSHHTDEINSYVSFDRYRNLLTGNPKIWDGNTVQTYPKAVVTTNDRYWLGSPVATGLSLGVTRFARSGPTYDVDLLTPPTAGQGFRPGIDPIRKATRVSVTPSAYTTFRPFDVASFTPSLEYRSLFYSFENHELSDLNRGYLLFKGDFASQIEKIWDTDNPKKPRIKNLIRPLLTYNNIPYVHEDGQHPFMQQIGHANSKQLQGYSFDTDDIVPNRREVENSDYFIPKGNSLTYGFLTQWVMREGVLTPDEGGGVGGYKTFAELRGDQTYNLAELTRASNDRMPLSRVKLAGLYNMEPIQVNANYAYVPYKIIDDQHDRHRFDTSVSYLLERQLRQRIFSFTRLVRMSYARNYVFPGKSETLGLGGIYSLNDYIMPDFFFTYDYIQMRTQVDGKLTYQSPSQCWKFEISLARSWGPDPKHTDRQKYNNVFNFNFSLNLTGAGYGGVTDVANGVSAPVAAPPSPPK